MELVIVICGGGLLDELVELGHCPLVKLQHILGLNEVVCVEAVKVAEAVAGGVAELEVVLRKLLEDLLGAAHIDMVVGRACPQADHICAELLDDVGGVNAVAEGLVHCTTLAVDRPAVGQALLVRCAHAQCADGNEQRRLEPATVLVAALHVHVCRPEALVALHCGIVSRAGVEPAVEGVGLFGEVGTAAVRALEALRQKLLGLTLKPCVRAVLLEDSGNGLDALVGADGLAAVRAVENGDGQTPAALTGDAPVGTLTDHRCHAILTPCRQPADILACLDGLLLEAVNRAEPLRSGTEDDRVLASPAVRVAVDDILGGEQNAAVSHVV